MASVEYIGVIVHSPKLTYKMNGWNIEIPFEMVPCQGTFVHFQGFFIVCPEIGFMCLTSKES